MIINLKQNATKSISLENMSPQQFGWSMNADLIAISTAYREVPWFRAAIDERANGFSNMPFDVMSGKDVLYSETDFEDMPNEINIFGILHELVKDLDMYGGAYALYEDNPFGMNGAWRRLHPATIFPEFNQMTGELLYFERRLKGIKKRYEPDDPDFLYLWMPNRSYEIGPGDGVGKTALRASSILNSTDIFQNTFFSNGAINPTLVQIKGFATQPPDEKERVQNVLSRMMTSIKNAFKVIPIDSELNVFTLMQNLKDMAMTELTATQRENISTATGVPHSLLFSNAANFATAQQDDFNFYDKTIAPFANLIIAHQLNERFFKRRGLKIKYVKSRLEVFQRLEVEKVDKLTALFDRAIMDENEVRDQVNLPVREDDYEVPSRLLVDEQEAASSNVQQKAVKAVNQDSAFAYLALPNDARIIRLIRNLKERFNDERIEWQAAPTYHVTLAYATMASDSAIYQMEAMLKPFQVELHGAYLDVFETPQGKALHIRLENSDALMDLQKHVYDVFAQLTGGLSEFSKPENWKPHITLGYLPNDIEWEIEPMPFHAVLDEFIVGRNDYEPELIVRAAKRVIGFASTVKSDFDKWENMALKRWKEGKREKALSFQSESLPPVQIAAISGALEDAQSEEDVKAIFAECRLTGALWGTYA